MTSGTDQHSQSPVAVIRVTGEDTPFLATRDCAAATRERLEALPAGQVPILDWAGIEAVTIAFADELVGKLLEKGRPYGSVHATEAVREVLDTVLRRRAAAVTDLPAAPAEPRHDSISG